MPSVGVGQQLDDHVEQFGHARPAARRDEANRHQVAFAQRLFQRRVQFGGVDVAVVQVAVDEGGVDLDDLLDECAVRRIDAAEIAVARAVVEAVDHLGAARVGQVQRQALAAEGGLDVGQQRGKLRAGGVDLVDHQQAVEVALGGVVHHSHRHRVDAADFPAGGVDHHHGGLHRLERRQCLADEVGRPGRVDHVNARAGMLEVHHRGIERVLHLAFEGVEIADRAAALQAAGCADRAGTDQQRFGQAGLSRTLRPDQREGADVWRRL